MSVLNALVTALVAGLFVTVAVLLASGARAFRQAASSPRLESLPGRQVNMRIEVLWTGCAALLLLAVFAVVR
jgi:heme/copper-type cytochrome/quinol oxidase subunit 2